MTEARGGRTLDDAELVDRARVGDVTAFEVLVARHQEVAVRVATVIGGAADAPDVTQEAFVKAWRALDRFRAGAPFRPWLLRIVANEARNARRAAGRRASLALRATDALPIDGSAPLDALAIAAEDRRRLVRALELVSDADRDVISCRYLAELSERETAAVLGCRPGTVKSRLSRALDRLRVAFDTEATPVHHQGGAHG